MTAGERPGEPGREEEVMESKEFEEKMAGLLRERFGETAQISVQDVLKNNGVTRRGIRVVTEEERFTPVLYLDTAYERYLAGETAGEIFEGLMEHNDSQIREMETEWDFQPEQFADYSHVKEYLRLRLVNYGKNTELLRDMPYVRWNDLAAIFYYEIGDGQAQIQINNRHLALWEETVETLYQDAMENMKNSVPDELFPLSDLIGRKAFTMKRKWNGWRNRMWERPAIRRRRKGRRRTASRGRASTGASGGSSILPRSSGFRAIWQISREKAISCTAMTILRWRPSDTMTAGRSCPL